MARPVIRCLLAAPSPGVDVESGDMQYCRDLLADPPPGVEYVTYPEALASGELRYMPTVRRGAPLPRGARAMGQALARAGLHGIRRAGMLLPDPVHWWEIVGRFDLVHTHCFPLRLTGRVPPVVATDSAGTFWFWTVARGRSEQDVWTRLPSGARPGPATRHHPSHRHAGRRGTGPLLRVPGPGAGRSSGDRQLVHPDRTGRSTRRPHEGAPGAGPAHAPLRDPQLRGERRAGGPDRAGRRPTRVPHLEAVGGRSLRS